MCVLNCAYSLTILIFPVIISILDVIKEKKGDTDYDKRKNQFKR